MIGRFVWIGRKVGAWRRVGVLVGGAVVLGLSPTAALAQDSTTAPEAGAPLWQWLCVVVFVGLCCASTFKNPKRSHLS